MQVHILLLIYDIMNKYILVMVLALFVLVSCSYNGDNENNINNNTGATQNENGTSALDQDDTIDNQDDTTDNQDDSSDESMSFFVTSVNPWSWGDLWGLEGADQYCQTLAENVWEGDKVWHAYLSTTPTDTEIWVNAKDRIWSWPWYNVNWELIASNVDELHTSNNINKETALTENADTIMWRWDEVNIHDILTWSTPEWTFSWSLDDTTCENWTSSTVWSAIVGHHDRVWLDESDSAKSWNSSHLSSWCSLDDLESTWWAWLFYCFAVN